MAKDKKLTGQSEEGSFSIKLAILFEFTSALKETPLVPEQQTFYMGFSK